MDNAPMGPTRIEWKLNIVSLANLAVLLGLLGTGMSAYSTFVSNWTKVESRLDVFNENMANMWKRIEQGDGERKKLFEQDAELRLSLVAAQAQTNTRLATVEAELRVLSNSVTRLENALAQSVQTAPRR